MNLNSFRIALTFAGCFLGAGFVSGQELWQFFGAFGLFGLFGLVLSMTLLFFFGVLLMRLSALRGTGECDKLIIRKNNKFLRAFVGVATVFFLLGIAIIMSAGVGALFAQQFSFSPYISSALFCIIVYLLALGGHNRMVYVFSLTVPLLVVFTVIIGILSYIRFPVSNINYVTTDAQVNPFLKVWWLSALTFVSYNLFSSVEILAPLGAVISGKRRMVRGMALGSGLLLLIAICIYFSMYLCSESASKELPMLFVAEKISPALSLIYAVLLFFGMLGTALSSLVGAIHYITEKNSFLNKNKKITTAFVVILIYMFGLFGFGDLIGTVYPICGYFGIAALILMAEHLIHLKIKRKNK